jgi:thiosulfate dehydrogenase (quinone) large subunit
MGRQRTWTLAGNLDAPATTRPWTDTPLNRFTGTLLGLVRIAIGVMWFQQTLWKPPPNFGCQADRTAVPNSGLCDWIGKEIAQPKFDWYRTFLVTYVQPNIDTLGWVIYLGELTTAVLLILGLLTRLGGLLGAAQGVNLTIGLWGVEHEWYWTYIMLALLNLLFALTAAGRWWGLDGALLPRVRAAAARGDTWAAWLLRLM